MKKKEIYFDCSAGVSGDMVLSALISLGADKETLEQELKKLNLGKFCINMSTVTRGENEGTITEIAIIENHMHHHDSEHSHSHSRTRDYSKIKQLIEGAELSEDSKRRALNIYRVLGEAEAEAHGVSLDEVHFHEVGRETAILNIVGAAICADLLDIEEVYCSPVHDGKGFVKCSHGIIPVPVPAVAALLKNSNIELVQEDVNMEMVTPSGLAILKGLNAKCVLEIPENFIKISEHTKKETRAFGKRDTGKTSGFIAMMI